MTTRATTRRARCLSLRWRRMRAQDPAVGSALQQPRELPSAAAQPVRMSCAARTSVARASATAWQQTRAGHPSMARCAVLPLNRHDHVRGPLRLCDERGVVLGGGQRSDRIVTRVYAHAVLRYCRRQPSQRPSPNVRASASSCALSRCSQSAAASGGVRVRECV